MAPTENSLPIGHDLEIIDDDDNVTDNVPVMTPHTSRDSTSQAELAMSAQDENIDHHQDILTL